METWFQYTRWIASLQMILHHKTPDLVSCTYYHIAKNEWTARFIDGVKAPGAASFQQKRAEGHFYCQILTIKIQCHILFSNLTF